MEAEIFLLSRIQFALTIMFHYLFPPLSIGLGALMVLMEGMYLRTGDGAYHRMTKFWTKIFAVNFAMGVATGIVMEFQFGTNWARYARYVGDVFGSALAAEGIFAFFLESGFLSVLVFGWDRVSKGMHFFATLMVSLGSIFSAIWIIIANSWQHTPVGFEVVDNQAVITDFWAVVFNPSSMNHLVHAVLRRVHPRRVLRPEHLGVLPAARPARRVRPQLVHPRPDFRVRGEPGDGSVGTLPGVHGRQVSAGEVGGAGGPFSYR